MFLRDFEIYDLHLCLLVTSSQPPPQRAAFFWKRLTPDDKLAKIMNMEEMKKIIALHGAGMTAGVWDLLPAQLPGYCLRAVTLPGHGDGQAPLHSIENMARWLRQEIGSTPCTLVGHSMGALVALATADHSAVEKIILCGAALEMPVNADLLRMAAETPDMAAEQILKWGVFSGNPEADAIRTILQTAQYAGALANDLAACDAYKGGPEAAVKIQKPALVIAGVQDKMCKPSAGVALAAALPLGESVVIDQCGHMMIAEKPVETSFQIRRFLER